MATNQIDTILVTETVRDVSPDKPRKRTFTRETRDKAFPSVYNNNYKLRTDTDRSSNASYASCTSLLTQYIKVEDKLKWKFLPEQHTGSLLVITKQILEEILEEELEIWTKFQSGRSQYAVPATDHNHNVAPSSNKAGRCLSHSNNIILIHKYFHRFTKANACVKLCIATPPPGVTNGFTYPSSVLRPIFQPEEPAASRFTHTEGMRFDFGKQRQLGELSEDEKRALELAYLCAEFPVLSAPPPPELEQEEYNGPLQDKMRADTQYLSAANIGDELRFQSLDSSSFCSHPNTLSPLSNNTIDINVREKPHQSIQEKFNSENTLHDHNGSLGSYNNKHITESQHIETVEMLLAHLRQAFGLVLGDFNIVGKSVRSKACLFVKGYTGKSETLFRELQHRYQVLEKCQHPYYRQNAFPSKAAYDSWLKEEKSKIIILIERFYHRKETEPRIKPVVRVPLPRDLHKCYSILLSILLQYELSNCLTGYLDRRDISNPAIDMSVDSIQQLRHTYSQSDKETFHPSTTRLLEEYALRYGISDTYRHLAFLDCLTREFSIHTIQDCRIIDSILAKLISKLYQLSDIVSAHPRALKPCPTTTLLKQERTIFLQSLHQLSKKIQELVTVGVESIASANCVNNNNKAIKRILNSAVILLELVMDTHRTLLNLTSNQVKGKSNIPSVKEMLTRWLRSFVAETYGQQKLRIAEDHKSDTQDEASPSTPLSPVMLNKLLSIVSLEIRRMREYYQEPFRNYFNVSQLITSEYYHFICQDIEYLCRRHCRAVGNDKSGPKRTEEKDLNMLGLMFNLDHNDTVLWTSYLPEQSIAWRNEFLRLFIEKWNPGIEYEMSLFIKSLIRSDKWESKIVEAVTEEEGTTNTATNKKKFFKSPNSAFCTLGPQPNSRSTSMECENGPIIPQSVHGNKRITFSPNGSITEDEATMRDRYLSPSASELSSAVEYDINEINWAQSHTKIVPEASTTEQGRNSLNLSVFPKGESSVYHDSEEGSNCEDSNLENNTSVPSPLTLNMKARMKLPVSNSVMDLLVIISRYNALIINILHTLSPIKFARHRSHLAHTGLPLEVLEVKNFVEDTKKINTQMKQALYTEASNTMSKICLTFAYNFICMDYCGLSRDEALEIMNGDKDNLLGQLEQLTADRLLYGCRHTIHSGDYTNICNAKNKRGSVQKIEKLSKNMALRINNLYVLATMWEGLNSQLLQRMSTRNMVPSSAYFWSTSTTDMQIPQFHNKFRGGSIGEEQLFALTDDEEQKIERSPARVTERKLEEALKLEVNVLAYKINSGFLQFFSILIELDIPEFNERQRLAPALNYLGDCLKFLGKYLYPDVFRYLLQRIWYNIIKGLECKAKGILKRINAPQRASAITEQYLHVLSCLINFFTSTTEQAGLDPHLLMETSEFFSYLLHFHILESVALIRVFNVLREELSGGYQIEFNASLGNENRLDLENTISAHTGLSRAEVLSYLDTKLSSFRKSFTGKQLIAALMTLRADSLPSEWKCAQHGWEPVAREIAKELVMRGDIAPLNWSEENRTGTGERPVFSLNSYYRIVRSRRIVRSINLSTEENSGNIRASNLSLYQDSENEFEGAKVNTLQYIYDVLKMREREQRANEFLKALTDEFVGILNRNKKAPFEKLLILHEQ